MVFSSTDQRYVLRRSSFVAVAQALLEFVTSLEDMRLVLVGSSTLDLPMGELWPVLEPNSGTSQPDWSRHNACFWVSKGIHPAPAVPPSTVDCQGCALNLAALPENASLNQQPAEPLVMILGLGDRFSVLLQAAITQNDTLGTETLYELNLVYDPVKLAACCHAVEHQLINTPELSTFKAAIADWSATANLPLLQSEFTLKLLTAVDTRQPTAKLSPARPIEALAKAQSQPQHWLQQERLLYELLHVSNATLGPQVILRRSAEVIRNLFGVSRCLIAFYSPHSHQVIWGAIARSPDLLTRDHRAQYPEWQTVEQLLEKYRHSSTWVTDEFPLPTSQSGPDTASAQAILASWTQANPQRVEKWVGGFLAIEQWDYQRTWEPAEMYLLHMAIHQVEQAVDQALHYQQAEERAQREALLNRLVAQIRTSLDLAQIFKTVTIELGQLVIVDRCSISQFFEETKVWRHVTEYRSNGDVKSGLELIIPDENNPLTEQLRHLQIAQVSDTRLITDPVNRAIAEQYPGSWLMVPIHRNQQLWGCLSFGQDDYPRYWHESELQFLKTVADQLAIAIHQATLYQQIQQQKQTLEEQVAHRTAELESFFDTLPDYIFVVERQDMRMAFCNHAFAQGIGFNSRQQVQDKLVQECFIAETADHFIQQNLQVFESGQTLHEQERLTLPTGTRYFDTFKVPLKKPNGDIYGLLGTSRDITELIKTKQALSERTEQLQDALTAAHAASQAKSEFLATMSHELRTPLTSVIGMSSALLKQFFGSLNPKQMEYLRVIHNSGNHLLNLINDILDLAKIESGKASLRISQFSLREAAVQCLDLLQDKAEAQQVELITRLDGLPVPDGFYGDERRVKQILLNLLSNAVKFTPPGGQVWLRMQYDGNTAMIEVEDTGIGIPSEKQHLLFEAFQQIDSALNRQHEGTGLGLALTRQLVEMHNGSIQCHSTPGVGTSFTIYLKAQPPKLDAREDVSSEMETTSS